jgi:acrylyl-CoA reductase (NADPH)
MSAIEEFNRSPGPVDREFEARVAAFAATRSTQIASSAHAQIWMGDLVRDACRQGLAGIEVPAALGGLGLGFGARIRAAIALAKVDFSLAFAFINHHSAALRIAVSGSEAARETWLAGLLSGDLIGCTAMSESAAGSDFAAIRTTARKVDGGWVLDGEKRWVANARGCEIALVFAQTDRLAGTAGIACFIVDLREPGCTRLPEDPVHGLAPAGIGGFALCGYRVRDTDVLYASGEGFRMAMAGVNKARTHVAAMACGLLSTALHEAVAYASSRMAFGRPVLEQQGLRWSLVDVSLTLETMELLTLRATQLANDEGTQAVVAAAMAKKFAGEQCLAGVAACIQSMGATGMGEARGLVSKLVAAKALCMADGTTEMMNERIGASLGARQLEPAFVAADMAPAPFAATDAASAGRLPVALDKRFRAIRLVQDANGVTTAEVTTLDDGELPPGNVVVRIAYSTLNYKDALAITGQSPVVRKFPMVPGIDLAGTVEHSEDARYRPGDRVLLNGWGVGETHWGGLAQRACVRADWLVPLPATMSERLAMCIGTAGYTAMLSVMALEARGVVPEAGVILVTGANGGVGSIAIALLARLGYAVTASTGRPEEAPRLNALGATCVMDRRVLGEPGKPLQKEAWAGAIDCVGSHTLANVLAGIRYGGAVAACGLAQGMELPGSVAPFILRGVALEGVDSVHASFERRTMAWARLARELPCEVVAANTREIALAEALEVSPGLLRGQVRGRVVVDVNR